MPPRLTRRELLAGAGAFALLSRIPVGLAIGPSTSSSASTPGFIDDLIAKMTVEEKAGQLTLFGSALQTDAAAAANPVTVRPTAEGQLAAARAGRLTGIFNGSNVRWHQRLQQAAMESRLKIPLVFAADVIHGFTTVFPVPLAEAASFEPELARRTARAAAVEATAVGHRLDVRADGRHRPRRALGARCRRRRRGRAARPTHGRGASARVPGRGPRPRRCDGRLPQALRRLRRRRGRPGLQHRRHLRAHAARGVPAAVPRRLRRRRADHDGVVQRDLRRAGDRATHGCSATCCAASGISAAWWSPTTPATRS